MEGVPVLQPRWHHDFNRARALARGIQTALEEDVSLMVNNHVLSHDTWALIDELHDIGLKYLPESFYDDDE